MPRKKSKKKKYSSYRRTVAGSERARVWSEAQAENRKLFATFLTYHPHLKYEDVFIITPSKLKMKGGLIYKLIS